MKRKLIILLIGYYILGIIQSCDLHYCEDVDYYDFNNISITVVDSLIETEDSLNFVLQASDLNWMAQCQGNFSIFQNSYALACEEGWAGMKTPLTKIEITSNADFSEEYPANTILNDLITIDLCTADGYYDCDRKYLDLNNIDLKKFMNPQNQYMANLFIITRPTEAKEHKFTFKLYKSDGSIITSESEKIVWK
jgi:hypothetical protein